MKIRKFTPLLLLSMYFIFTAFSSNPQTTNFANYNKTYAVVIGIADYKYEYTAPDLTFTINDAEKFIEFLKSQAGGSTPSENIYYLKNDKAKKANILHFTQQLFEKAGEKDRVIFFYSGHGLPGGLCPHDAAYNSETDQTYNILSFDELKNVMKSAKCKTKMIFADACHSGSIKKEEVKSIEKDMKKSDVKSSNGKKNDAEVAIMVAASADEYSVEYQELKQGVFSYYLIQGLEGAADKDKDKKVTIEELHHYVFKNVKEFNPNQTPITFGKFDKNMVVSDLK